MPARPGLRRRRRHALDGPARTANSYPGRVIYRAGANQFGGAMKLGLRRGGDSAFVFNAAPLQVGHTAFSATGTTLRAIPVGGLGFADAPLVHTVFVKRGFVTQPTMAPAMGSPILYPGPKLTTMLGHSSTGPGAVFYLLQIATGPMGTHAGRFTTHYAFGQATGTVLVQNTGYSWTFFTIMGSDARSSLGAGNLSLAAGGMIVRHTTPVRRPT